MLAVLTVRTTYLHPELGGGWYGVFMPLVVLAIPLYDFTTVTVIRLRQGRSPFVGDQQHFSHRLVRRGLSTRGAVVVIWALTRELRVLAKLQARVEAGDNLGAALKKAGVPAELHIYEQGRHGLGLAQKVPALSSWPRRCADWIRFAEGRGLPWIPVNAPRYARPRDRIVCDVLTGADLMGRGMSGPDLSDFMGYFNDGSPPVNPKFNRSVLDLLFKGTVNSVPGSGTLGNGRNIIELNEMWKDLAVLVETQVSHLRMALRARQCRLP